MAAKDHSEQYRKDYQRGWDASYFLGRGEVKSTAEEIIARRKANDEGQAWFDGWEDHQADRKKWSTPDGTLEGDHVAERQAINEKVEKANAKKRTTAEKKAGIEERAKARKAKDAKPSEEERKAERNRKARERRAAKKAAQVVEAHPVGSPEAEAARIKALAEHDEAAAKVEAERVILATLEA